MEPGVARLLRAGWRWSDPQVAKRLIEQFRRQLRDQCRRSPPLRLAWRIPGERRPSPTRSSLRASRRGSQRRCRFARAAGRPPHARPRSASPGPRHFPSASTTPRPGQVGWRVFALHRSREEQLDSDVRSSRVWLDDHRQAAAQAVHFRLRRCNCFGRLPQLRRAANSVRPGQAGALTVPGTYQPTVRA